METKSWCRVLAGLAIVSIVTLMIDILFREGSKFTTQQVTVSMTFGEMLDTKIAIPYAAFENINLPIQTNRYRVYTEEQKPDGASVTVILTYWELSDTGNKTNMTSSGCVRSLGSLSLITNPLIVFTDSNLFANTVKRIRRNFALKTKIVRINRDTMWPFELIQQIHSVTFEGNYPTNHPKTFLPKLAADGHSKYAAMATAVKRRYFNTALFAWLDINMFIGKNYTNYIRVCPPEDFNQSRIATNIISGFSIFSTSNSAKSSKLHANDVLDLQNGRFVIGSRETILKFERNYHDAVLYFLDQELMNTDRHILLSTYSDKGRKELKPQVDMQAYTANTDMETWMSIEYVCANSHRR